jgi:hypothetical protein
MTENGSHPALPLTLGGGLLSDVKLKKWGQELTLARKVGLLQDSGHTARRPRTAACCHDRKSTELVEQRLGVLEVDGTEALGEPPIDRCEQVACLGAPALLLPQPSEARGSPQLP